MKLSIALIFPLNVRLPDSIVSIPATQLVIGLAGGWAGKRPSKFLFLHPEEVSAAYRALIESGGSIRGFMFWVIQEEGTAVDGEKVCMSEVLGRCLSTCVVK